MITQQANKRKIYTESKATNFMVQLDLIKRPIFLKNVRKVMNLKT